MAYLRYDQFAFNQAGDGDLAEDEELLDGDDLDELEGKGEGELEEEGGSDDEEEV